MIKNIFFFLAAVIVAYLFPLPAFALEADEIVSESAILMDAETGQVLFDKNGDKMMFPASTTKIMTGLLAVERGSVDDIAEVTDSAVNIGVWGSSNIALVNGEQLPVDSLMYALMLPSANDAANVLAEHIAGNQRDFAQLMTERARAVGAMNTHFANAHGLHDPNHYTTARDLALITREAIKNPVFAQYFGAGTYTIPATNLQPLERPFTNYNYMLVKTSGYYDPRVIGGKVGYTGEAGHTMSVVAQKDGRTLICVVLSSSSRGDKFSDSTKLFDFGFNEFTEISVPRKKFSGFETQIVRGEAEIGRVDFTATRDFKALLHSSIDPDSVVISYSHDSPFNEGEDISAYVNFAVAPDNPAIPDTLGRLYLQPDVLFFADSGSAVLNFRGGLSAAVVGAWWFIPLVFACIVVLVFAILFIIRRISLYNSRKRRRERLERLKNERETLYTGPRPMTNYRR